MASSAVPVGQSRIELDYCEAARSKSDLQELNAAEAIQAVREPSPIR
jgi:hypothetical protein